MQAEQWETLRQRILSSVQEGDAKRIFGKPAKRGGVYRWGVAVARGTACDEVTEFLSRVACDGRPRKRRSDKKKTRRKKRSIDLGAATESFVNRIDSGSLPSAVAWDGDPGHFYAVLQLWMEILCNEDWPLVN